MYNHNKAQQSKNRVHISWDIPYVWPFKTFVLDIFGRRHVLHSWCIDFEDLMLSSSICDLLHPNSGISLVFSYRGRVTHVCVSELCYHWIRKWLVAYSVPNHYLCQFLLILNWTRRNLFHKISIATRTFLFNKMRKVVGKMAVILSRSQCVNKFVRPEIWLLTMNITNAGLCTIKCSGFCCYSYS